MENIFQNVKDYYNENKKIILYSLILTIISFGYELFNFSFSIDEEISTFLSASEALHRIIRGRYGLYFLNILLIPHSVLPYFPFLFSLIAISVVAVLFVNAFRVNFTSKLIFVTLFVSFPFHAYYLSFNLFNFGVGFGLLCSVASFLFTTKFIADKNNQNRKYKYLAVISLFLSFSIYQGMMTLYVFMILAYVLYDLYQNKLLRFSEILHKFYPSAVIYVLAFVIYKAIHMGLLFVYFGNVKVKSQYLETFIMWGKEPLISIVKNLTYGMYSIFTGIRFYGGFWMFTLIPILVIILFVAKNKIKSKKGKWLFVLLLLLLSVSPFLVMYIIGTTTPIRSLLALPFLLGFIWMLFSDMMKDKIKYWLFAFSLIIMVNHISMNTRLFFTTNNCWNADRDMANRIIERIHQLDIKTEKEKIDVLFVGNYSFPENELFFRAHDIFGASFFYWDEGNPKRIEPLFKSIGVNYLNFIPKEKSMEYKEEIIEMPSWPYKGSVDMINDMVIVKLSNDIWKLADTKNSLLD